MSAPARSIRRYVRLLAVQLRTSTIGSMQYRTEFVMEGLIALLTLAVTLVPLVVVFGARRAVAGWTYPEALLVVGWFAALKGLLEGAISPSLTSVVEQVRTGTLDFVLLKPADAQFLISTTRFQPWRVIDLLASLAIFGFAFSLLGRFPAPSQVAAALFLLCVAVLILYSIWILVVSAAFWVVKVDNLSYLFSSLFDVARWPVTVFRGVLRFVFTFVLPLALMTTYPALALLGKLSLRTGLCALAGGLAFAGMARLVWLRAIGLYTSASS